VSFPDDISSGNEGGRELTDIHRTGLKCRTLVVEGHFRLRHSPSESSDTLTLDYATREH
jgi:hypothetical protein